MGQKLTVLVTDDHRRNPPFMSGTYRMSKQALENMLHLDLDQTSGEIASRIPKKHSILVSAHRQNPSFSTLGWGVKLLTFIGLSLLEGVRSFRRWPPRWPEDPLTLLRQRRRNPYAIP